MGYDCAPMEFKRRCINCTRISGSILEDWVVGDNQFEEEIYIFYKSVNIMENLIFEIDINNKLEGTVYSYCNT